MSRVDRMVKHYKGVDMPHLVFKVSCDTGLLRHLVCHPEVCAFSTTRHGGVSTGTYASLNCTPYTGDDPQCVSRNQEILLASLPQRPEELIIPWQTHGTRVLPIDDAFLSANEEQRHALLQGIDALVHRPAGICLCISTADCIPILLYDRKHQAIAAVPCRLAGHGELHSRSRLGADAHPVRYGRGRHLGRHRTGHFARRLRSGRRSVRGLSACRLSMDRIARKQEKWHLDLWEANRLQLLDFGVPSAAIETAGICTYTHCDDFFSARRLGIRSGRMLTGIMLNYV